MNPRDLTEAMFQPYPPLGRSVAIAHLSLLRTLPTVLDAILLRELQEYDTSFPTERSAIDARFTFLASLSNTTRDTMTQGFAGINLSPALAAENWVQSPRKFEEDLSAWLWASHQIDTFHTISADFVHAVEKATPATDPATHRLAVLVLPPDLHKENYTLFRKLLPYGTLFAHADPGDNSDSMDTILQHLAQRAEKAPIPYGHWYIDGSTSLPIPTGTVSSFSWNGSEALRASVLSKVQSALGSGSAGPEMLRSIMSDWAHPERVANTGDPLVNAFVERVYGEGSGTQIFSTTFVQWSSRELLRRAQPLTLVARFGPRQRQRGMNEMFTSAPTEMDFAGSAVDADFAAWYTWINLQRLPGADNSSFIAWSQHDNRAIAIGPGFPRGTESPSRITIDKLLNLTA